MIDLDLSFVQLVLEASLLVQMVLLLLLLISIYSWTLILRNSPFLKKHASRPIILKITFGNLRI
jgi:biopolymer transport protein TolQ